MVRPTISITAIILGAVLIIGVCSSVQTPAGPPAVSSASAPETASEGDDYDAIRTSGKEFAAAFNKGNAGETAALWTTKGESRDATGRTLVGRDAIEKAFAELFKQHPGLKVEVLVDSIRFPAKDMAVEEGLLRYSQGEKDLPTTSEYVAVHVRENGKWKIALSTEGGVGQDRLEDLAWLLGKWTSMVEGETVTLSFTRDPKRPMIQGAFSRTVKGKEVVGGTVRIALDPETGLIRSWGFETDGGHSQSLWHCDGKSWVLDSRGVLADGTPTEERIILQRVGADAITWRAIDRVIGEESLPDTQPMRLTRKSESR